MAIEQRVPGVTPEDDPACNDIKALAQKLSPDVVQLFYTVAVHSRSELALSPDEYAGFVMACLRMLALLSGGAPEPPSGPTNTKRTQPDSKPAPVARTDPNTRAQTTTTTQSRDPEPAAETAAEVEVQGEDHGQAEEPSQAEDLSNPDDVPAWEEITTEPEPTFADEIDTQSQETSDIDAGDDPEPHAESLSEDDFMLPVSDFDEPANYHEPISGNRPVSPTLKKMTAKDWPELAAGLAATGVAAELARQSEWLGVDNSEIILRVAVRTLAESPGKARLCTLLSEHFGQVVTLRVEFGVTGSDTAHAVQQAERQKRQHEAEAAAQSDPLVLDLLREFDARILPGSIVPLNDKAA